MGYFGSIQVKDKSGWGKTYSLDKALAMVGSGAFNDVCLPEDRGSGVASVHLQIIRSRLQEDVVRVVNLVNTPVPITSSRQPGRAAIPASSALELGDGDSLALGDFTLVFSLQSQSGVSVLRRTDHLGLKLELPDTHLMLEEKLEGRLTLINYGDQPRCQFTLDLMGFPDDCYQIDPAPLLYPGAEERVRICFFHQGIRPEAGPNSFTIRATAVGSYPTEMILLTQSLDVLPVYGYRVQALLEGEEPDTTVEIFADVKDAYIESEKEVPAPAAVEAPLPAISPVTFVQQQPATVPAQPVAPILPIAPALVAPEPAKIERKTTPRPRPVQKPAEQDGDWWSAAASQNRVETADPLSDFSQTRKKRPSLNPANIQVIRAADESADEGTNHD